MYHGLDVEGNDRDLKFPFARWLLSTHRVNVEDLDEEDSTLLIDMIDNKRWKEATFLIEFGSAAIDVSHLWLFGINWSSTALGNPEEGDPEDVVMFLRALLPRVDFPRDVYTVLVSTVSPVARNMYLYRELVETGMIVRERVKALYEYRRREMQKLSRIPSQITNGTIMSTFDDGRMDMSTLCPGLF
jgi:hypothetical protein